MCIIVYIHHETQRENRRREALVLAGGRAALAAGFGVAVVAAGALHSRKLPGLCSWGGPCQLGRVGPSGTAAVFTLCAAGSGARAPAGGRAGAAVAGVDAGSGPALPGQLEASSRPGPRVSTKGGEAMIEPRYRQQTLYEQAVVSFMPDSKKLLWEGWMLKVDEVLEEDELVEIVHKALQQRHPQSGTRGRKATPAEGVLR